MPNYVVIATWPFGQTAVKVAADLLKKGKPALDSALAGAQAVEDDPRVTSVGYGGLPNAIGTVQLDACVMDGATLACGGVAALENIRHPAALARLVMEKTPHLLLVGEGARLFGVQHGFPLESLHTPESLVEWAKTRPQKGKVQKAANPHPTADTVAVSPQISGSPLPQRRARGLGGERDLPSGEPPFSHDTVTVLAMDQKGNLAGVCSTSGRSHKLPGRVGDSPLIGAGLYVDNTAGAAGATGEGEEIIRIGGSFLVVEAMRAGKSAQAACEQAVRKVNQVAVRRGLHPARVAFLALDPHGKVGAACTARTDFKYAVGLPGKVELLQAVEIDVGAKE
jgi:isoaspartyl peptidase/L-asparaginase-like protein (Ntn-hydrolase superfamily)